MSIKDEVGAAAIDAAQRHTRGVGDAPVEMLRPAGHTGLERPRVSAARPQVHDTTGWA